MKHVITLFLFLAPHPLPNLSSHSIYSLRSSLVTSRAHVYSDGPLSHTTKKAKNFTQEPGCNNADSVELPTHFWAIQISWIRAHDRISRLMSNDVRRTTGSVRRFSGAKCTFRRIPYPFRDVPSFVDPVSMAIFKVYMDNAVGRRDLCGALAVPTPLGVKRRAAHNTDYPVINRYVYHRIS